MSARKENPVVSSHPPVSKGDIAEYVNRTHLNLPADYRKFLRTFNGGIPQLQQMDIPNTNHSVIVDYLYGIMQQRVPGDLEYETSLLMDDLPRGFIVIGHDPGGNSYVMATQGERRGSIYFWDKRGLISGEETGGNTFWLADGITSLLHSMYATE